VYKPALDTQPAFNRPAAATRRSPRSATKAPCVRGCVKNDRQYSPPHLRAGAKAERTSHLAPTRKGGGGVERRFSHRLVSVGAASGRRSAPQAAACQCGDKHWGVRKQGRPRVVALDTQLAFGLHTSARRAVPAAARVPRGRACVKKSGSTHPHVRAGAKALRSLVPARKCEGGIVQAFSYRLVSAGFATGRRHLPQTPARQCGGKHGRVTAQVRPQDIMRKEPLNRVQASARHAASV
jgi:hypothetical protein